MLPYRDTEVASHSRSRARWDRMASASPRESPDVQQRCMSFTACMHHYTKTVQ